MDTCTHSWLSILPCLDNDEIAALRRHELSMPHHIAEALGRSAVEVADCGRYMDENGNAVVWKDAVEQAKLAKLSIRPECHLSGGSGSSFPITIVHVSNETTLGAGNGWSIADCGRLP